MADVGQDEVCPQGSSDDKPSYSESANDISIGADTEHLYVNTQTLMGNAQKNQKVADSNVGTEESGLPETQRRLRKVSDESKLFVEDDDGMKRETTGPVTTDVRSLASQFEQKQLQNLTKHELKIPVLGLTGDFKTAVTQPSIQPVEPFAYALARDVPELIDCEVNRCAECKSLPIMCHNCESRLAKAEHTGRYLYDENQQVNVMEGPCQLKCLTDELRLKFEARIEDNTQIDKDLTLDIIHEQIDDTFGRKTDLENTNTTDDSLEQTIYDSVCERSISLEGFEVVNKGPGLQSNKRSPGKHPDLQKYSPKVLHGGDNYEWKRKEAKRKSRTLKRPSKSENRLTHHSMFEDPSHRAIPEAERDDGIMEVMSPFSLMDEESVSVISDFTDSSFDSSDSEKSDPESNLRDSYSKKPLPPEPAKPKGNVVRDLRQLIYRGDTDSEDRIELEKVNLRRKRDNPMLPAAPPDITQNQIKLRGVLQSLIDSEKNYITSLDRLVKVYQDPIQQQFGIRKTEVVVTFNKVEEILQIHQMFQIELGDKLTNWTKQERIGNTFHLFSGNMVLDIYSDYVNNYEVASELIKEVSNTKQAFRDFLKEKQMSSTDRLSLPGLMLKPIQRFPQFIMIIKDLLKYTPREHHDRVPLQEALTGMENVAHQLNERKRQSEQYFHGHQIAAKLTPRVHLEKKMFLIRQDDVEQIGQDSTGQQTVKQRRLFLMNDKLISVHVTQKELNGGVERFTYKWHQSLGELELTTSAITPNMQTTLHRDNTVILSPKIEQTSEDPYSLATDLTDMIHDINLLAKIQMLVSALKNTYSKLNEDLLHEVMTNLQKDIQGADYQLQLLNSSSIILHDKARKKKYVFSAANASVKQGWCIDFLLAKYALDVVNIPSWHKQEFDGNPSKSQPALLMKHLSVDMQRMFTRVKCAVPVYFPMRNEGSVEHLWVCCSTASFSQVSIVSLHTARPALIESFQATQSEIVCSEMVPGYAYDTTAKNAFAEDTVWMSTTEAEVLVFMLSERDSTQHRRPVHTFKQPSVVLCMLYVDDRVFCGNRNGNVIVYNRNDFGEWTFTTIHTTVGGSVKSIICVNDTIWVACGPAVVIIDAENNEILDTVFHQQPEPVHFNCLVKAGVGVWASFLGKSNISLYHIETKNHLQDFNIGNAINDFLSVHSGKKDSTKSYEVTSLMASLGLLWIGTDIGLVLTYPLPRLRDGVPKINQRPSVALHGHNRPVQFIIPVHYGPVSGSPVKRRPSEILKKTKITQSVLRTLPKLDEQFETVRPVSQDSHNYLSLDAQAMSACSPDDDFYDAVDTSRFIPHTDQSPPDRSSAIYEDMNSLYEDVNELRDNMEMGGTKSFEMGRTKGMEVDETQVNLEKGITKGVAKGGAKDIEKGVIKEVVMGGTVESPDKENGVVNNQNVIPSDLNGGASRDEDLRGSGEHTYFVLEKNERKQSMDSDVSETQSTYTDMTYSMKQKGHLDNLDEVFRPKSSPIPKYSPVNFQSELKNKLKHRKSLDDLADLDVNTEEVGRLYGTLMRQQSNAQLSYQDSSLSQNINYQDDQKDLLYVRPNYKNPITPQKPNYSSMRKVAKLDSVKQKRQSVASTLNKSKVTSSFSTGVDTLRRQDSNTILVLTGGDGYKDWKKRQNLQSLRPEEPSLVFWLYKF